MTDKLVMPNTMIQGNKQQQQAAKIGDEGNGRFAFFYGIHTSLLFAYHSTSDKGVNV